MKLGLCIEGSTRARVQDVERALAENGHQFINFGMKNSPDEPELTYLHTGFLSALFLNLKIVDFVVGGCGTGQGYMNAVLQFPGTACGLLLDPVDAWLFSQINAGNIASLALNKGYGSFGADINVSILIERLFRDPFGQGYPAPRREIQKNAKKKLDALSLTAHRPMEEIVDTMDTELLKTSLNFPGILSLVEASTENETLKSALLAAYKRT